jgi:acyl carrier protein
MINARVLHPQITKLFSEKLNLEIPSIDMDLVEEGILDSLAFVDLIIYLEEEFGMKVFNDSIDIDNFRSISKIAQFVGGTGQLEKIA